MVTDTQLLPGGAVQDPAVTLPPDLALGPAKGEHMHSLVYALYELLRRGLPPSLREDLTLQWLINWFLSSPELADLDWDQLDESAVYGAVLPLFCYMFGVRVREFRVVPPVTASQLYGRPLRYGHLPVLNLLRSGQRYVALLDRQPSALAELPLGEGPPRAWCLAYRQLRGQVQALLDEVTDRGQHSGLADRLAAICGTWDTLTASQPGLDVARAQISQLSELRALRLELLWQAVTTDLPSGAPPVILSRIRQRTALLDRTVRLAWLAEAFEPAADSRD